jgi:hypothetical protein
MTEEQWLAADDADATVLNYLRRHGNLRQGQLLACAMCRSISWLLKDERLLQALDVAESLADLRPKKSEIARAVALVLAAFVKPVVQDGSVNIEHHAWSAVRNAIDKNQWLEACMDVDSASSDDGPVSTRIGFVRCIFGNPFGQVEFSPEWRTETVLALVRGIEATRDYSAIPILADALEDAGCDSEEILNHCRGPGPHVLGCWVVRKIHGSK